MAIKGADLLTLFTIVQLILVPLAIWFIILEIKGPKKKLKPHQTGRKFAQVKNGIERRN